MTIMNLAQHVSEEAERPAIMAALFRALGDPSRLEILQHLKLGPHRVVDLVDHLGLAQSTVSKHLSCLRECGLVTSAPQGRASMFALVPGVPIDELQSAAESVLVATGAAAAHCSSVAVRTSNADDADDEDL